MSCELSDMTDICRVVDSFSPPLPGEGGERACAQFGGFWFGRICFYFNSVYSQTMCLILANARLKKLILHLEKKLVRFVMILTPCKSSFYNLELVPNNGLPS